MEEFWKSLGYMPVILWSDAIVFVAAVLLGAWFYSASKRAYWIQAFKQIATNRLAMWCLGVMSIYATVGFIDTLHFKKYNDTTKNFERMTSVLDVLGRHFTENVEKTYSTPFATHAFTKETLAGPTGAQIRMQPELKFGGQHLRVDGKLPEGDALDSAKHTDIAVRIFKGVVIGLVLGALAFGALTVAARGLNKPGPWVRDTAIFVTAAACVISAAFVLSGGYHVLGTDQTGNDVFWQSVKGTRTGMILGSLTTLIVTPFAILFGVLAGYFGGWIDDIITYVYSTLSSIPDILLIAAAMLIVQSRFDGDETVVAADKKLVMLCIIMGITSWTGLCRMIRAETLKLRQSEFVQAADAFGIGHWTVMYRHLVPNVTHLVIISVATRFSSMILTESVLAYIGIGVDESLMSWGTQIEGARMELARDPVVWWNLISAFIFSVGLVLPANLFGDAVRDALDPKLRTV